MALSTARRRGADVSLVVAGASATAAGQACGTASGPIATLALFVGTVLSAGTCFVAADVSSDANSSESATPVASSASAARGVDGDADAGSDGSKTLEPPVAASSGGGGTDLAGTDILPYRLPKGFDSECLGVCTAAKQISVPVTALR